MSNANFKNQSEADAESARKAESNHQIKTHLWMTIITTIGMILAAVGTHASIKKYDEHI